MMKDKKTRIVSGFPGIGKSTAAQKLNDPYNGDFVMDSDSSIFPKDKFPQNYLEHIYYTVNVLRPTILFVSSHELVRQGLADLKIKFDLVYPAKKLLGEYVQRFIDRGNEKKFIDLVFTNWDSWIDDCEKQEGCNRVELQSGQYLSNYISEILYPVSLKPANPYNEQTINEAVEKWMAWTHETFPMSGAKASLIHLQEEVKEVIEALEADEPTFISEEGIPLMEFADCMICLFTAAGKSGFTIEELFRAIQNKMNINYKRKWILNPDNTYSHVKQ